ncbi:hypothetical protein, partial [Hungatella sp.]|uniref:hypothetical protein n=1 Tax=Hungatella sp. TaxID=2613924 RepID=UPI002A824A02
RADPGDYGGENTARPYLGYLGKIKNSRAAPKELIIPFCKKGLSVPSVLPCCFLYGPFIFLKAFRITL